MLQYWRRRALASNTQSQRAGVSQGSAGDANADVGPTAEELRERRLRYLSSSSSSVGTEQPAAAPEPEPKPAPLRLVEPPAQEAWKPAAQIQVAKQPEKEKEKVSLTSSSSSLLKSPSPLTQSGQMPAQPSQSPPQAERERAKPTPELLLHQKLCSIFSVCLEQQSDLLRRSASQTVQFLLSQLKAQKEAEQADASSAPLLLNSLDIDSILTERLAAFSLPQAAFAYLTNCFGRTCNEQSKLSPDVYDACLRGITTQVQLIAVDNAQLNLFAPLIAGSADSSALAALTFSEQQLSQSSVSLLLDRVTAQMESYEVEAVFGPTLFHLIDVLSKDTILTPSTHLVALSVLLSRPRIAEIAPRHPKWALIGIGADMTPLLSLPPIGRSSIQGTILGSMLSLSPYSNEKVADELFASEISSGTMLHAGVESKKAWLVNRMQEIRQTMHDVRIPSLINVSLFAARH